MANLSWKAGKIEIYQIVELQAGEIIQDILTESSPELIKQTTWLYPDFVDGESNLKSQVQSFLIKSQGKNILIDTCNGNLKTRTDILQWGNLDTDYLEQLRGWEVVENDIDLVINTHMHMDHVGWNTRLENGVWVPTFPRAKYIFAQNEYDYWKAKPEKEISDDRASFEDSIVPVVKAGLAVFIDGEYKIDESISLIPTPGHTPGHLSVLIHSGGKKALISGDILFHPIQIANLDWLIQGDTLPDQARQTRKTLITDVADTDTLFLGSHFANPVSGKVVTSGSGFIFRSD